MKTNPQILSWIPPLAPAVCNADPEFVLGDPTCMISESILSLSSWRNHMSSSVGEKDILTKHDSQYHSTHTMSDDRHTGQQVPMVSDRGPEGVLGDRPLP
jgi:hypothetical protein